MTLKTRKPTGAIPWPVVLIEGGEKAGKTVSLVLLSASPKVGRTAILFLGEPISDEYGAWPGARYEIIEHDGSWASIIGQVEAARAEAQIAFDAGEPPFVLGIDNATAEWELLKDWGSAKARSSPSHQRRLKNDPAAEVKVPTNIWNEVGARHARLMTLLLTFPGIVVLIARGKEVASIGPDGNPVEGKKDYRVEGHKNLCFDVSCWIRMYRDKPAIVVGARSVHAGIRPGRDDPQQMAADWSLEGLIFNTLRCDPKRAAVQEMVRLRTDTTPAEIRDEALHPYTTPERIAELWREARDLFADVVQMNEHGDDENLVALLERVGKARRAEHGGLQTQERTGTRPDAGNGHAPAAALASAANGQPDPALTGEVDPWDRDAQAGAPHRIRREDQGAPRPPTPKGDDDAGFVNGFTARVADAETARDQSAMSALLREIGMSIGQGKVTPKTGGELADLVRGKLTAIKAAA